jgi:hypothetical protein
LKWFYKKQKDDPHVFIGQCSIYATTAVMVQSYGLSLFQLTNVIVIYTAA